MNEPFASVRRSRSRSLEPDAASCDPGDQQPARGASRRRVAGHGADRRRADRSGGARARGAAGRHRRRRPGGLAGAGRRHVHINEPGRTEWEGFATATRAAAAGGVTTLVDMPLNCIPVTTTRAALEAKLARLRGPAAPSTSASGAASCPATPASWPGWRAAGVLGCKAFLVHSGIDEFPQRQRGASCARRCRCCATLGLPLLAHAELDLGGAAARDAGDPRAYAATCASRPRAWEDAAIALLIAPVPRDAAAPCTSCTSRRRRRSTRSARGQATRACRSPSRPARTTCASRPRRSPTARRSSSARRRSASTRTARRCGAALLEGVIDFVVTDHSPCTPGAEGCRARRLPRARGAASRRCSSACPRSGPRRARRGARLGAARRAG